jgi:putative Holliday junction resolvase
MRILGVDVGTKRIGLAMSDPTALIATGIGVIDATGEAESDAQSVAHVVRTHGAGLIVVGLPTMLTGEEGAAAEQVRAFADTLARAAGVPIELWDERLTTAQAEKAMLNADASREERRQRIDKVAAALILQSYLDAHHGGAEAQDGHD